MIRQPALFCSFSSAETQWIPLLRILGNMLITKNILILNLKTSVGKKQPRLSDPAATCARNFDYQINQ